MQCKSYNSKIFLITLIMTASLNSMSFAGHQMPSELYSKIANFMLERGKAWFMPPPHGTRETNVSAEFCSIVSVEKMNELATEFPDFVQFNVVDAAMGLPVGAQIWQINQRLDAVTFQNLSIYLAPDGFCEARYRHYF